LSKQHETEWSVVLHNQLQLCKYWALIVKGAQNKVDTTRRSIEVLANLPPKMQAEIQQVTNDHHPATKQMEYFRQLCLAVKYHKQLSRIHKELQRQTLLLSLKEI
jgi:hypothetical protein